MSDFLPVPLRTIGPLRIITDEFQEEVLVPLATYEKPLWPSTQRGMRAANAAQGVKVLITNDVMTRSIVVAAPHAAYAYEIIQCLNAQTHLLEDLVRTTSRFAQFKSWHHQLVGRLLYMRIEITTGDAAGHNMATKAAEKVMNWLLSNFNELKYISISGNYCTDKKNSAVNGILGRGKYVIAEVTIPEVICKKFLRTTPAAIKELNIQKNLLGSIISGSVRTANAHFANILLALYLATGQDAANIVEGSQGFVVAEVTQDQQLYFSVTLPNVIVGTVGNGKNLEKVQENLALLKCLEVTAPGVNARRLAAIVGATVLCGELSLLAAQTNRGELMRSHELIERSSSFK